MGNRLTKSGTHDSFEEEIAKLGGKRKEKQEQRDELDKALQIIDAQIATLDGMRSKLLSSVDDEPTD
ncbi:MAG: hypothetical protein ACYTBJ_02275 [Planctomycetota bacterium]